MFCRIATHYEEYSKCSAEYPHTMKSIPNVLQKFQMFCRIATHYEEYSKCSAE
jgi:hypothetical protein